MTSINVIQSVQKNIKATKFLHNFIYRKSDFYRKNLEDLYTSPFKTQRELHFLPSLCNIFTQDVINDVILK